MKRYLVISKETEAVVAKDIGTRKDARLIKKKLELEKQSETGSVNRPSAYFVETDVDHPSGPGLYTH